MAEGASDCSVGVGNTNLQGDSCAGLPPGDVFYFDVSRCGLMNDHMESWGEGWGGPLDMLKDTCGALGAPE